MSRLSQETDLATLVQERRRELQLLLKTATEKSPSAIDQTAKMCEAEHLYMIDIELRKAFAELYSSQRRELKYEEKDINSGEHYGDGNDINGGEGFGGGDDINSDENYGGEADGYESAGDMNGGEGDSEEDENYVDGDHEDDSDEDDSDEDDDEEDEDEGEDENEDEDEDEDDSDENSDDEDEESLASTAIDHDHAPSLDTDTDDESWVRDMEFTHTSSIFRCSTCSTVPITQQEDKSYSQTIQSGTKHQTRNSSSASTSTTTTKIYPAHPYTDDLTTQLSRLQANVLAILSNQHQILSNQQNILRHQQSNLAKEQKIIDQLEALVAAQRAQLAIIKRHSLPEQRSRAPLFNGFDSVGMDGLSPNASGSAQPQFQSHAHPPPVQRTDLPHAHPAVPAPANHRTNQPIYPSPQVHDFFSPIYRDPLSITSHVPPQYLSQPAAVPLSYPASRPAPQGRFYASNGVYPYAYGS
ncbi:uncharacterized protein BO97DRAFT_422746 [Aspergillus homomorphus CBS 101889]|uniref:Uncharacterized protein n=1 Tax=Aspergillus homomorphus (strain CBS 101889) TaxID=1450537 RepID=A0A395I3L2_ASPHC|nr:hypothetical protein BO97DRAFT_422746 [Aspergillus homomorphus CBS 101889]RAL14325.1 hypothetical protein BO97DRAFT_422746 [Aspergillus homomorphus CBS 101889]